MKDVKAIVGIAVAIGVVMLATHTMRPGHYDGSIKRNATVVLSEPAIFFSPREEDCVVIPAGTLKVVLPPLQPTSEPKNPFYTDRLHWERIEVYPPMARKSAVIEVQGRLYVVHAEELEAVGRR